MSEQGIVLLTLAGAFGFGAIAILAISQFARTSGLTNELWGLYRSEFIIVGALLVPAALGSGAFSLAALAFGLISAGGTAGALVGPVITRLLSKPLGESGILYVAAAGFIGAIVCQRILLKRWARQPGTEAAEDRPIGGNVFAGVTLIAKSPYLLGIALFIVGISAVSTILYFEQLRIVADTFADTSERTRVFARMDWIARQEGIEADAETLAVLAQNIAFSLIVKIAFVALVLPGVATLWMAVFADMGRVCWSSSTDCACCGRAPKPTHPRWRAGATNENNSYLELPCCRSSFSNILSSLEETIIQGIRKTKYQ